MNRVQLQDESGIKSRFFSDLSLSVPDGLVAVRVSSGHLQGSVSLVQGDCWGGGQAGGGMDGPTVCPSPVCWSWWSQRSQRSFSCLIIDLDLNRRSKNKFSLSSVGGL